MYRFEYVESTVDASNKLTCDKYVYDDVHGSEHDFLTSVLPQFLETLKQARDINDVDEVSMKADGGIIIIVNSLDYVGTIHCYSIDYSFQSGMRRMEPINLGPYISEIRNTLCQRYTVEYSVTFMNSTEKAHKCGSFSLSRYKDQVELITKITECTPDQIIQAYYNEYETGEFAGAGRIINKGDSENIFFMVKYNIHKN